MVARVRIIFFSRSSAKKKTPGVGQVSGVRVEPLVPRAGRLGLVGAEPVGFLSADEGGGSAEGAALQGGARGHTLHLPPSTP